MEKTEQTVYSVSNIKEFVATQISSKQDEIVKWGSFSVTDKETEWIHQLFEQGMELHQGEIHCVINSDWVLDWFNYCNLNKKNAKYPGKIPNCSLVMNNVGGCIQLRTDLDTFCVVPEKCYDDLVSIYGGGPRITRQVQLMPPHNTPAIEIHPKILKIIQRKEASNEQGGFWHSFSQNATFEEVIKVCFEHFGKSYPLDEVAVMDCVSQQSIDKSSTLQSRNILDGQGILIHILETTSIELDLYKQWKDAELKEGDISCVVNSDWLENWKKRCADPRQNPSPGPISNQELIECEIDGFHHLKSRDQRRVSSITETAFDSLIKIYGGGPKITRKVTYAGPKGTLAVEYFPKQLEIYVIQCEDQCLNQSQYYLPKDSQLYGVFSAVDTFKTVLNFARERFDMLSNVPDSAIQIWDYFGMSKYKGIPELLQCELHVAKIEQRNPILIVIKSSALKKDQSLSHWREDAKQVLEKHQKDEQTVECGTCQALFKEVKKLTSELTLAQTHKSDLTSSLQTFIDCSQTFIDRSDIAKQTIKKLTEIVGNLKKELSEKDIIIKGMTGAMNSIYLKTKEKIDQ